MQSEIKNLGQSIIKYQVPLSIYYSVNQIYELKINNLPKANKQLIGKINNEHSLYYAGPDNDKMTKNNFLTKDIFTYFVSCIKHYLHHNNIKEYDPVHVHRGNIDTGLSSVMILKLPPNGFGIEYSAAHSPQNGKLQFLGSASGQFAKIDYEPNIQERDFFTY